ncbi:MAG: methyltransferase domain-containing protein [Nocardiopsaceae bacterium]|nr:methyltransferase domain-containing protein [Nocardiopsaceae bacterium]
MATYPFAADRAAEHERLLRQGSIFDPLTRRLLEASGLAPGMRVLDIGCGAGNVARLAAEIVGPTGHVTAVDVDPAAIEITSAHNTVPTIEYGVADAQTLDGIGDGFDAVTGRLVLMYLSNPAAGLREAAARVRPGGLVIMEECDLEYLWASPQTPVWTRVRSWLLEALEKAQVETRMGPALFSLFGEAGLPMPQLLVGSAASGGPDTLAWGWGNVVAAGVPAMERFGVATRQDVDPATLPQRLVAETIASGGCAIGPLMTGAWAVRD